MHIETNQIPFFDLGQNLRFWLNLWLEPPGLNQFFISLTEAHRDYGVFLMQLFPTSFNGE